MYDESIQLVKDGTVSTATNAAGTAAWPVVANTVTTYGNNADLWKTTWTPQVSVTHIHTHQGEQQSDMIFFAANQFSGIWGHFEGEGRKQT